MNENNIAEYYINTLSPNRPVIARYWITDKILVGGNILNMDDLNHLKNDYNIKSIINVDAMQNHTGAIENLLQVSVLDNGDGFSKEIVNKVVDFASANLNAPIYIHCHLGFSRSPHFAYAILRACYKYSKECSLQKIKSSLPTSSHEWGFNQHTSKYIESIELALLNCKE